MPELYMPGAATSLQSGGVTLDTSLPPRAVWHITWDALKPDGSQPEFSAVSNYLKNQGYCPNIMWNPFTGFIEQYYPGNVGGRALTQWNQDGKANIQIEIFFSPGCVVNGKRYATVADTPCVNLDKILAWLDSYGIPREWPMGSPQWQGNPRDVGIWNNRAGHYGHSNVPNNTHTDPGPMPDITFIAEEDDALMAISEDRFAKLENKVNALHDAFFRTDGKNASIVGGESVPNLINKNDLKEMALDNANTTLVLNALKQVIGEVANLKAAVGAPKV